MQEAFVLLNVEMLSEKKIVRQLKSIEDVLEVYETHGVYDVIAKVRASNDKELEELMRTEIHKIKGVNLTLALLTVAPELSNRLNDEMLLVA